MSQQAQLIRDYFKAYETNDRAPLDRMLADDFTFTSPQDDKISRDTYFQRCWPSCQHLDCYQILRLVIHKNEGFVTYRCHRKNGTVFENTEVFTFEGERITHIDVYFGLDSAYASS
ncbi:MAG: nuclear transport factor 2 family protein [Puniceicoccales bacterium]